VDELVTELRALIQEACDLDDGRMSTLKNEDPIVGPESPLGLDSLDALEIVTAVQRKYAVRIDNKNTSLQVLQSLNALADFIRAEKARA
jgi:acyl carrier protein